MGHKPDKLDSIHDRIEIFWEARKMKRKYVLPHFAFSCIKFVTVVSVDVNQIIILRKLFIRCVHNVSTFLNVGILRLCLIINYVCVCIMIYMLNVSLDTLAYSGSHMR